VFGMGRTMALGGRTLARLVRGHPSRTLKGVTGSRKVLRTRRRCSRQGWTPPKALDESLSEITQRIATLPDLGTVVSLPPLPDGTESVNKVQLATSCIILCVQVALMGSARFGAGKEKEKQSLYTKEVLKEVEALRGQVARIEGAAEELRAEDEEAETRVRDQLESSRSDFLELREQFCSLEETQAQILRDQVLSVTEEVEYIQILQDKYKSVSKDIEELRACFESLQLKLEQRESKEEKEEGEAKKRRAGESLASLASPEAMRGKPPPSLPSIKSAEKEPERRNNESKL